MEEKEILNILKGVGDGSYVLLNSEYKMLNIWFHKYILTDDQKNLLSKTGYSIFDLDEGRYGIDDTEIFQLILDCNKKIGSDFFFILR